MDKSIIEKSIDTLTAMDEEFSNLDTSSDEFNDEAILTQAIGAIRRAQLLLEKLV